MRQMDRVALFVDAGYLFAGGSKRITGHADPVPRKRIKLDNAAVCDFLREIARETNLDLLRIYWYDGVYAGEPNPQQNALSYSPCVKVRLGVITGSGKQKGVDSLIVTDMINLSRNRAMASAILLAGDEDLRVGMQQSQEQGVHVHLVGWPESQSNLLKQEADSLREISLNEVQRFMSIQAEPSLVQVAVPVPAAGQDPLRAVAESVLAALSPEDRSYMAQAAKVDPHASVPREIDRRLLASFCTHTGQSELKDDEKRALRATFREVALEHARYPAKA